MDTKSLVTVVIPNYNHTSYLKKRIESVLLQSYQNFELYILDDCSTDSSLQIIKAYENHSKVKAIIKNESNSGSVFKQWTRAILLAKGKYLWIAESDDYADLNFLKETVKIAEKHDKAGLVFTDSTIINESGTFIGQVSKANKLLKNICDTQFTIISDRNMVLNNFVYDLIIWNASSVLFKTKSIEKTDLNFLQSLSNAGDLFTYMSIALKEDIIYLNKPLNYLRKHGNNTTEKSIKSGVLFKDRLSIIYYFIHQLNRLNNSKPYLKSFLSRNFLVALDFKLYGDVNKLLKVYYNYKILSLTLYLNLYFYVCHCNIFKKVPNRYRVYIKRVLAQKT